jgi:hypothetical protein
LLSLKLQQAVGDCVDYQGVSYLAVLAFAAVGVDVAVDHELGAQHFDQAVEGLETEVGLILAVADSAGGVSAGG